MTPDALIRALRWLADIYWTEKKIAELNRTDVTR